MSRRVFCATLLLFGLAAPAHADEWKEVLEDDGITVYARQNAGNNMPTFRGEGIIPGSILDILAVFKDGKNHTRWMHACKESTIIERYSELEALVYNRTEAPWPVSDRDVVVHAKLDFDMQKREAWNHFESVSTPLKPEVKGVVRMPHLEGFYHLLFIDPENTAIVYQVNADPGGLIPDWLARLATKRLPLQTIRALRDRVIETRADGRYHDLIAGWVAKYDIPVNDILREAREGGSAR